MCINAIRVITVAYLFTLSANAEELVWWAFPIAETCALVVALLFMKQISKEKLAHLAREKNRM